MALNDPRTIPFAFKVVEIDGWAWLYDDSERTYICSFTANVYAEPLYAMEEGEHEMCFPDAGYWQAADVEKRESFKVPLDDEDIAIDVEKKDAWDSAREEAHGNCLI